MEVVSGKEWCDDRKAMQRVVVCRGVRRGFWSWRPCGDHVERGALLGGNGRIAEWLGWSNDGARGRQEHEERLCGGEREEGGTGGNQGLCWCVGA